ncbi:MAG: YihY/virulence factor BrkB family protein [Spirochaetes bacterium]|nr:YihY/virulence factor BrkB family protein [Spirochaetota bacterium]
MDLKKRRILLLVKKWIIKLYSMLYKATTKFYRDRCFIISNGLAFKTIFALFPIAAIFFIIFSFSPSYLEYKEKFIEFLIQYFFPETVTTVVEYFNRVLTQNTGTISLVGTIVLIYLSLNLFITLDSQVNFIWSSRIKRTFIQKVLIYWAILTITPIVLTLYFYYSGIIRSIILPLGQLNEVYFTIYAFLLLTVFFFFLYYIIPNVKVHVLKALIVSAVVSVIWNILRIIFTYYTQFAVLNWKIYGTLAVAVFFMIWISINWMILLFGMVFLQVWQEKLYLYDFSFQKFFLFDVGFFILILKELYIDFAQAGKGYTLIELSSKFHFNINDLREIFRILEKEELIVGDTSKDRRFFLRKDIASIYLKDIEAIVWKRLLATEYRATTDLNNICGKLSHLYFQHSSQKDISIDRILTE